MREAAAAERGSGNRFRPIEAREDVVGMCKRAALGRHVAVFARDRAGSDRPAEDSRHA